MIGVHSNLQGDLLLKSNEDLIDAASDTVVHVFELAGFETKNGVRQLTQALQRPDVQAQILRATYKDLIFQSGRRAAVTGSAAYRVRSEMLKSLQDPLLQQVEGSQSYKDLQKSVDRLVGAARKTPYGMWVDENRGLLILSGLSLAIGGAYGMYRFRTGDSVASQMAHLTAKLPKLTAGRFEAGITVPTFVPSKRAIDIRPSFKYKGRPIEADVDFGLSVANDKVKDVTAGGTLIIPVGGAKLKLGADIANNAPLTLRAGVSSSSSSVKVDGSITGKVQGGAVQFGLALDTTLSYKDVGLQLHVQDDAGGKVSGTVGAVVHF
jgi:hypothetical protein